MRPESYYIENTTGLTGSICIPASKSSSIRTILAGSISNGISVVKNVANNLNTNAMRDCCVELGAQFEELGNKEYRIKGINLKELDKALTLNPQNSGIVLRLLLGAVASLKEVHFISDYTESLGKRSNIDMLQALQKLGVKLKYQGIDGRLPISLDGSGLKGGFVQVSGRRSSQFLSGLLFLGGILDEDLTIQVTDELKSKPMVRTSLDVLRQGGINVEVSDDMMTYFVPKEQMFKSATYQVNSDPASAAALLAIAGIVDSDVRLYGFKEEEMGNGLVLEHLKQMGVQVEKSGDFIRIRGGGDLDAKDFDGSQAPDAVLPLTALACYAKGTSIFYNIEHIRYKECDRISDFRKELIKAGADVEETLTELIVHGKSKGIEGGVVINSHFDHAVIMALTALGLRANQGIIVKNAQHVGQTYPDFFKDIQKIGCKVTSVNLSTS